MDHGVNEDTGGDIVHISRENFRVRKISMNISPISRRCSIIYVSSVERQMIAKPKISD